MSASPTAQAALAALEQAASDPRLSASAVENIRKWLSEPRYAEYVPQIAAHLRDQKIQELDDVFWTVIPFGTGGRRGTMYPIGSNAINDRTIGESAQGLAAFIRKHPGEKGLSCAIAYDTRHRSRDFAELCAAVMVANGFHVFFLDDCRSTPELSFLVRQRQCSCGIMVTASHNPPSDNAVKVYWSTGGQVLPPHDAGIIAEVMDAQEIPRVDFATAVDDGRISVCTSETDAAYLDAVMQQALPGPRDARIVYSPLHGVGEVSVAECLRRDGFEHLRIYEPHRERSGDFPNVPGHVSNPENSAVFDAIIAEAQIQGDDLILATDPDCDRMGAAAPLTVTSAGPWATFTGNQLGVLLCDYILERRREAGRLSPQNYIVTTLVTTQMISRVAESYGVRALADQLVGFKWICGRMDQEGPDDFVFGTEESHGFLVGQYARDKDGAVACMLLSELAAKLKAEGISLHEKFETLQWQHGCHAERLINIRMEGSEGMALMTALMARLRAEPPQQSAGLRTARLRDYGRQVQRDLAAGQESPLEGPRGDLVMLDMEQPGNYLAVRPSGTEPKVKMYLFTCIAPEQLHDMAEAQQQLSDRLDGLEADLRAYAES